MKSFIVVALIAFASLAEVTCTSDEELVAAAQSYCAYECDLPQNVVEQFIEGDFSDSDAAEEFVLCYWTKRGIIENGVFNTNFAADLMSDIDPNFAENWDKCELGMPYTGSVPYSMAISYAHSVGVPFNNLISI